VARLEFFYDVGSPWTYLAFHKIEGLAAEARAELVWKPILVGGVFNAVNPEVYEARAQEAVLREVAKRSDLDADALLARIEAPEVKARLLANTEELVARSGFGSPTLFVTGDDMYFGNGRLPLVREAPRRV